MTCAVAIFAKTIGLSAVKTRLAADLGQEKAEAFYDLSVRSIEGVMQSAAETYGVAPYWVLAEETAPQMPRWQSFPALWTGEGGLGARLASVSERLFERDDAVMLIGTDSPHLLPDVFGDALGLMDEHPRDCVVGPAKDGGFYLLGSRVPVSRAVWEDVTYSEETTLAELMEKSGRKFHRLRAEQDVDVMADLATLKAELTDRQAKLQPAQRELLDWLAEIL